MNKANQISFKRAQKKRVQLLSLLPDKFTPSQAAEVWKMTIANTNAMTQKMRRYKLIIPNKGKKGRILQR